MNDMRPMTPREYANGRRNVPFGGYGLSNGRPDWRKIGGGYIAVTDGTAKQYVAAGLIFAVEIRNSKPCIISYWRKDAGDGLHGSRPYALWTLKTMVSAGMIVPRTGPISYDDMIHMVRSVHPGIWIPDPIAWYAEYGLVYDEATGEINNPFGLAKEEE